jgi:hypothetical protein
LKKIFVNEDRLLKKVAYFFDNPSTSLVEIAQNAVRAGATKLDITVDGNILKASDNGKGLNNPEAILVLASSDWEEEVENQNPAGWGLYWVLCISHKVKFKSLFGSLEVETERFLSDAAYRENIFDKVNPAEKCEGFYIEADLKKEVVGDILPKHTYENRMSYFRLDVTINGKEVEKMDVKGDNKNWPIVTRYQGNALYIDPFSGSFSDFPASPEALIEKLCVCWYGIIIQPNSVYKRYPIALDVTEGSPVTPVLPYREKIQFNAELKVLWQFIRDEAAKCCISYINNADNSSEHELIEAMRTLVAVGTQDELDRLERFFVIEESPYFSEENFSSSTFSEIIVRKGETIENEKLLLYDKVKDLTLDDLEGELVLPFGVITKVSTPKNTPSWLKVQEKEVKIELDYPPESVYRGNYNWQKADIKCKDKKIVSLGLMSGCNEGTFFYAKEPQDVYEIRGAVFAMFIYSDDGDQWDTQEYYFDKDIEVDISKITNKFSLSKLLEGFSSTANISFTAIKSINIMKNKVIVTTKKKGETFTLNLT